MSLTYPDIEEILKNGDFSRLKDQLENRFFDVKEFPYTFHTEEQKHEICKDVSAFANADGGFIIIGVSEIEEKNSPHKRVGEIKEIDP